MLRDSIGFLSINGSVKVIRQYSGFFTTSIPGPGAYGKEPLGVIMRKIPPVAFSDVLTPW